MGSNHDDVPRDPVAPTGANGVSGQRASPMSDSGTSSADNIMDSMMSGQWTRTAPGSPSGPHGRVDRPTSEPERLHTPPRRSASTRVGAPVRLQRKQPSLAWAVVAGIVIAGLIQLLRVAAKDDARRPPGATTISSPRNQPTMNAVEVSSPPAESSDATAARPSLVPTSTSAAPIVLDDPKPEATPTAVPRRAEPTSQKLREAPPGTPPDIAATFAKLPVSPTDRPPIAGVGASGIHVDRVATAAHYDRGVCTGVADRFSLSDLKRVNVCLRIVHPRMDETVSVLWQKQDRTTARRGTITIQPLHAYRTRAYLILRREYVGKWTVRIFSADGVELAAHEFEITP